MLVVLVMSTLFPSKGPELVGKQCPVTGAKIGKATPILMAKAFHLRSQPVMAALWCPTMLPQLAGPSDRLSLVPNSARTCPFSLPTYSHKLYTLLGVSS